MKKSKQTPPTDTKLHSQERPQNLCAQSGSSTALLSPFQASLPFAVAPWSNLPLCSKVFMKLKWVYLMGTLPEMCHFMWHFWCQSSLSSAGGFNLPSWQVRRLWHQSLQKQAQPWFPSLWKSNCTVHHTQHSVGALAEASPLKAQQLGEPAGPNHMTFQDGRWQK